MSDGRPSDQDVLDALAALHERWSTEPWSTRRTFTAKQIGIEVGLVGSARLGKRASKGNWSGKMSPALRVASQLRRMHTENLIYGYYDSADCRWEYRLRLDGDPPYKPPVKIAPKPYTPGRPKRRKPGR